jgi:hypothetical protein
VHTPVVTRQDTCEPNKVAKHERAVPQDNLSGEVAAPRTLHTDGTNVVRSLKCCVIVGTFLYYNGNAMMRCRDNIICSIIRLPCSVLEVKNNHMIWKQLTFNNAAQLGHLRLVVARTGLPVNNTLRVGERGRKVHCAHREMGLTAVARATRRECCTYNAWC